jgi:hypothetical protein
MEFRNRSENLEAQIATYKRQRWERPVLRGEPMEGNAALATQEALAGFGGLPEREREPLAGQLYYGLPLTAAQIALIDHNTALIAKLRAATQLGWAMNQLPLEQGERARVPAYRLVIDAVLLMLGDASRAAPDECLATATDAIRLGQDLVPGASLEAASVSMRITSLASPVLAHCAETAGPDAVLRGARELHELATHAPPSFGGIEVADIVAQVRLRALASVPDPDGQSPLIRLRRRPALFEAWSHFDTPTRWRELKPEHYPQSLDAWQREHEWRSRSELALVADVTTHVNGWLYDDMRGQALLRSLTVGMATVAERIRRQRTPREPISLSEAALCDPYNGQALKWRLPQDGTELTLWSVGEDRRDDKGSSEWTVQAPIDIVVHFRLRALQQQDDVPKHAAKRSAAL